MFTAGLWPSLSHRPAALAIAFCAGVAFCLLVLAIASVALLAAAQETSPISLRHAVSDLRLMGLILLLLACAAALRLQLIADASQSASSANTAERRAFDRWRATAVPAILTYQRVLRNTPILARSTPKSADRRRLLAQSQRTQAQLAQLARSARARPLSSDADVRSLQSMLARASQQAAAAETSFARGVRQSRSDRLRLAKRQVEQSAALMTDLTLRANAIGTRLAPTNR